MHKPCNFLIALSFLLTTGCHLGPSYSPPLSECPQEWKSKEEEVVPPNVDSWWHIYGDETLNCLEEYAIDNNPTLYIALQRVAEARAAAGVSLANLFPQLNLDPSYTNSMFLTQFQLPTSFGGGLNNQVFRIQQINNSLPLDLSYQLDLWGAYRGQYQSSVYHAEAVADAYYVALLTITADLAKAYFQMRAMDAQIDLLEATKKVRQAAFEVNEARWKAGLVNYTDVSRAALEFTNAEAKLFEALRLRNIQENQIALLTGNIASNFELPAQPLLNPPPKVPANIPSAVLLNRPDVAQAEREMASKHAMIGVAYAAFFPQISLTGALGFASPDLKNFLTWKSRLWALGAAAAQTIFDGGRNISNLDVSYAQFYEMSGEYKKQVLTAFSEVEDSLSNILLFSHQYESLEKSVESAKLTTVLSTDRYNKGLVNYLDVVDSERAELEVEISAINVLALRYLSTVDLIKAIGGSWQRRCLDE